MKQLTATEGHGYGVAGVTVYPVPIGQYDIDHGAVVHRHDVNCGATCRYRHGIIEEQFPERRRRLHNILVAHHLCRKHIAGTADAHGTHKDEKRDGIRTRNVEASRLWQVADAPRIGAVVDKVFGDKAECVTNAAYRVGNFNIIGIGAAQLTSHDMKSLRVARQLVCDRHVAVALTHHIQPRHVWRIASHCAGETDPEVGALRGKLHPTLVVRIALLSPKRQARQQDKKEQKKTVVHMWESVLIR